MAGQEIVSMVTVFNNQAEKYGSKTCVSYKKRGKYLDVSWTEMQTMVTNLALYLLKAGVKKGDRVGLFSENRYEWWVTDLAVQSIGAVVVPLYATNSYEEAHYILSAVKAKLCFVSNEEQFGKIELIWKKLSSLKNVITFDEVSSKKKTVASLASVLEKGSKEKKRDAVVKKTASIKGSDVATIIFTSGTTGEPKGVVLTHWNYYSDVQNTLEDLLAHLNDTDIFLSFLPLSHVLERTGGFYVPVYIGAQVVFAESMNTLMENFKEVRPTVIISVPRVYEKMHSGILSKVADAPAVKKAIFGFATSTAKKNVPYVCRAEEPSGLLGFRFRLSNKLVYAKLKAALGLDRIKFAISGGGPLSALDAEFFIGMGITILEGYGLTETAPITHVNRPGEIKPGSVGRAVRDTEVKIDDDGEILIKGPQVMEGYYKDTKGTKEVMAKGGFFRTGDLGIIDKDGALIITGRKKDVIVTAGGKNISPQRIENSVKQSRYIEQVGVIGDKRKYISALIIPVIPELEKWAKKSDITFKKRKDLLANEQVQEFYRSEIDRLTKSFGHVEQIKKFTLLNAEWSQENGELTPKQSVKRRVVEEKYSKEIEAMYHDEDTY